MAENQPQQQQLPPLTDRLDLSEIFADGVVQVGGGAGFFRIDLSVTRPKEGTPPTMTRVMAARLVLTLPAAIELHTKITAMLELLKQQGIISGPPGEKPHRTN